MTIVGIKFKRAGKIYYFAPSRDQFEVGDGAIVETVRGIEYGTVVIPQKEVDDSELKGELKPIIRKATDADRKTVEFNQSKCAWAMAQAKEKIAKNKLPMKLIDCEYTFDGNKIIFYFTSDQRVDFRELVKDLAAVFRIRIELRQVGIRDETKTLGGLGPCGKACCCSSHLPDFVKVSIKMAKTQNLSLNPQKISGLCGRLMCCLEYENAHYAETSKLMPKLQSIADTPDGLGEVVANNMLTKVVKVKFEKEDGTVEFKEFKLDEVKARQTMQELVETENENDQLVKSLED